MEHNYRDRNGVNPVTAGFVGIVLGAAGAVAVLLSDEEIRKKATKRYHQLKKNLSDWSDENLKELKDEKKAIKERVREKASNVMESEIVDEGKIEEKKE